ncbi:BNR repeat domain protein [Minicystis rosea]|nr:BNR repeat domain protein [Minicystis rosea]
MRTISWVAVIASVLLAACADAVEEPSGATSSSASTGTGAGGAGGSSIGIGGGPSGPESFVRFSKELSWCAVRSSGKVVCWQPVQGVFEEQPKGELTTVPGIDDATEVVVEGHAACALRASGKVACWGRVLFGDWGSVDAMALTTATDLPGVADVTALSAPIFDYSLCMIRKGGQVSCYDHDALVPSDVQGLTDAVAISGLCALRASGHVACFGVGGSLASGSPSIDDAIAVTSDCMLRATGEVWCSMNGHYQKIPGFEHITRVKQGQYEVCGIDAARDVSCWTVGDDAAKPINMHDAWDVGLGYDNRCVIHSKGELYCGGTVFGN